MWQFANGIFNNMPQNLLKQSPMLNSQRVYFISIAITNLTNGGLEIGMVEPVLTFTKDSFRSLYYFVVSRFRIFLFCNNYLITSL